MSSVIITSLTKPLSNAVVYEDQYIYKGVYDAAIDIGGISERNTTALNITIDWGDGTPREVYKREIVFNYRESSIFNEVQYGRIGGSVLGIFEHRYDPPETTHIRELSAQILINFDNATYTRIVQPILLVMESYYDDINELAINSMVIHDSSLFSIMNLQSKFNNRTWPAMWADNRILDSSVFPPPRVDDPPPDPKPPECEAFQCTGNPDHPFIDCQEGFVFNCNTCKCEPIRPPDYPPCYPCYPCDPNYPNYPNYPSYPCNPPYATYPVSNYCDSLCYNVNTYGPYVDPFGDNPLMLDPFGFNQVTINPDT